jgi:linoleoyl-CoA desaturase
MAATPKAVFNKNNNQFFVTLQKNVNDYFKANKVDMTGNAKLYGKAAFLISSTIASYLLIMLADFPAIFNVILCVVLGFLLPGIGFNIMHDGAHGSFSKYNWVNNLMGFSLNLMGGNMFLWKAKHNQNHHTFTNIEGMDDDINLEPWLRVTPAQEKKWFHRFQHIYWGVLYGMTYILWIFVLDYGKYFTGKVAETEFKKMATKDHLIFWFSKAMYILFFIVLPILKFGVIDWLIGYSIVCVVTGFIIAIVFQLAHVVEDMKFSTPDKVTGQLKLEDDWAVHQLKTTANFATKSRFIRWFTGGLNHQVEHHLFPRISHIHYPAINKIVIDTCKQFNIPYHEFPTLGSAIKSHVRYLKVMGTAA